MSGTVQTGIEVHSFQVEIPDEALGGPVDGLRHRRWPSKELVEDRSPGVNLRRCRGWRATGGTTTTSGASSRG
jgi:hypothetical protein